MERIKQIVIQICFPSPALTGFIAVPSFVLVAYVLILDLEGPLAYVSYILSAYGLVIFLTGCWRVLQSLGRHPLTRKLLDAPLGRRLREDAAFRAELSLYQGFAVNLLYSALKLASGIYYRSVWFGFLALYYALLAVMRFLLLRRKNDADSQARRRTELHRYRLCGAVLLMMNLSLAGIVFFMVHQNRSYDYPGTLIYAMAAYSFYAVITAVINMVRFRRRGSPVLSAAKAVSLVAALVSILSLQTAMLSQFGSNDDRLFRRRMIGSTGGAVCLFVLGMALFMIVKSAKELKQTNMQNL